MDCDPPLIKAHSLFHLLKKANHPMVCQSRGIVPDLCARMGQPRQPHNIKRVKELRLNLIGPRAPSTWVDESCVVMDKVPPTFLKCFLYGSSWGDHPSIPSNTQLYPQWKSAVLHPRWPDDFPLPSHLMACQNFFEGSQKSCSRALTNSSHTQVFFMKVHAGYLGCAWWGPAIKGQVTRHSL